jgi:hypothetical protein
MSAVTSAALPAWAVPTVRRMPRQSDRTPASVVGVGCDAARWAWAIATSRQASVAAFSRPAWALRYNPSVDGLAGSATSWWSAHQPAKCRQSAR